MALLIEITGNTLLFRAKGLGPAAFLPSGTGCGESCGSPLPDQASFKLRQRTKDMKNQFPPLAVVSVFSVRLLNPIFHSSSMVMAAIKSLMLPCPYIDRIYTHY
jgi:hypothetical protein